MSTSIAATTDLVDQLQRRVPALELSRDELELFGTDIFYVADYLPLAVARPSSVADVQALVQHSRDLKISLAARGAGLSYSAGYIAQDARTVVVDLRGMNRIIEVNERDRYVTVEPGVTWSDLRDALQPLGLTTPFWGTFSGRYATIRERNFSARLREGPRRSLS
jgi:FAD/FMN-containing dehydrogenase